MVNNDEGLPEWISFHRLVGYSHFFIYAHHEPHSAFPADLARALGPFVADGLVTVVPWPRFELGKQPELGRTWVLQQIAANNHCIRRYGALAEWMTVHDKDEYMLPIGERMVPALLRRIEAAAKPGRRTHFAAYSWFYSRGPGSSNVTAAKQPSLGPLVTSARFRYPAFDTAGRHKVFFRPSDVGTHSVHVVDSPPRRPRYLDPNTELRMLHYKADRDAKDDVETPWDPVGMRAWEGRLRAALEEYGRRLAALGSPM
ncbi:hypothetical protein DFJ74DRAFT_700494 [Hyaloraphidium curvatum]|nr:hypothetical protein DFJ74DRAFT_700494 [Hyaloraphidium curvatum]